MSVTISKNSFNLGSS